MNTNETATIYLNNGNQLLESGNLEEAIAAYRNAIELNPDLSWSYHNLGEALAKLGQLDEAITAFRRSIELNPDFSWSYHHLGDALDRQEQWEEAVVAFRRAIELNAEHFGTYYGLGHSLEKLGQLDEAIAAYRRASELEPETDWIQYKLGELLQQRTQLDLEGAITSYRRAIELNPDDVQAYRKLLEIQPDHSEVWLNLGKALVKQEQWEEAIATYRHITELNPDDVQAHYRLGELLIKQGDLEGAIDTLRHSLELSPNSDESYYNLGEALAAQGNATEASLCYYKAFKLNPDNMQANQKRPQIYDCFAFFNELDILKIRIEELKDVVDKFILVEATKTHSGNPKPLYYQQFIHEFAEYQDKIIHYVVDDMPEVINGERWPLENHQRDCIIRPLRLIPCNDKDIILISDVDEIPRKEKIEDAINLLLDNDFVIFTHDLYHNNLDAFQTQWWCGTVACKYKDFKVRTATQVRRSDEGFWSPNWKAANIRKEGFQHPYIEKGGWHLSYFGGAKSTRYKLQSFAHAEADNSKETGIPLINFDVTRPTHDEDSLGKYYYDIRDVEGKDIPDYLKKNIRQYRHFLKPKLTQMAIDHAVLEEKQVKLQQVIDDYNQMWEKIVNHGDAVSVINDWRRLSDLGQEVNVNVFNETGEFNVIKRFINQGQTVFDIGANVGGWTEEVLNAVSDIEVHLFEAVPKIYQELIKNISSKNPSGKLIPNNCAVSKTDGLAKICYYPDAPQWSTIYRRGFDVESTYRLQPPQSVEVLATTIDGYCNRLGIKRINFLKIDVEGAELDVLSGAINLLKSGRIDYIQFEYGGTYLDAGTTLEQIFALLSQYRYSIFKILPDQLEYLPNFSPNHEDFQFSNFLAVNERFRSTVLGEPPEAMLDISQVCKQHSVLPSGVIHVGAHEGEELKTYQEMGIKQVLFIEANPDVAERLKKRMAGMLEVQVVNCAISNQNGTVELIVTNNEMSSSILPLKVHGDIYPTIQVTHKLTVEAKTLDTLLEEMQLQASDFNILNIDIQGAELLAFQGATNLLKYIEVINTEVNYEELYEGCALIDQIDDFLEAYGFERRATTTPYNPTWGDACYVKKPLITMSTLGINGQFGNQIFQYAFLKIYAKQHNLRVETPEWIGQYLFGHNDPIISRQLPIVEERHPIVPAQIPYQKDPCKNVDFWGFFQYRTTFYAPHKEYFRSLFKPIQEVEATMKVALENLNSRGKTLIGIHLRRGDIKDFSLDENLYYYPAPTEWYKDWLRDIWENIEQPVLFVASDSLEEVIDDFAEFQPVTVKELGIDLPPASFYPDFYLLSQCEMVAISNSSFSFVTCLLNKEGKLFYRPCRKREKLIPFLPWDSYPLAEAVRMQ
ncbi:MULTISPECIES: FkbM family methyltransferase [unclassified Microcoleus]|uniref:FkbM family methyltransferase n=1 Tax=unclassified Microcoleus TaxID=2642155 RepID=UPI002FD5984A